MSDFCGVILASSIGARLYPVTSTSLPKHLLPIGGIPNLRRLIHACRSFSQLVIVVAHDDNTTQTFLEETYEKTENGYQSDITTISVYQLSEETAGTIEALSQVQGIPSESNIVVIPGDLVVLDDTTISKLCHEHRQASAACTMLLADVGEVDENGVPLKESAKQKKGGLAREEEEIEYIALNYTAQGSLPRVIWKQSKLDLEEQIKEVADSPKLSLPKPRLRTGTTKVRTEWNDLHVYALAPWVMELIKSRTSSVSLQADLVPLLVARQYRGKAATFGDDDENAPASNEDDSYQVLAHVVPASGALRAFSVGAYLYASKEFLSRASKDPFLPPESDSRPRFQSVILPKSQVGEKPNFRATIIGSNCTLGNKCQLNNVIVMDHVTIGDNAKLQNTIIGTGATIGENCSLNDCQVAPGMKIAAGTKEKGQAFCIEE